MNFVAFNYRKSLTFCIGNGIYCIHSAHPQSCAYEVSKITGPPRDAETSFFPVVKNLPLPYVFAYNDVEKKKVSRRRKSRSISRARRDRISLVARIPIIFLPRTSTTKEKGTPSDLADPIAEKPPHGSRSSNFAFIPAGMRMRNR